MSDLREGSPEKSSLLQQAKARAEARRNRQVSVPLPDIGMELVCDVPTDLTAIERMREAAKRVDKGRAMAGHFSRALVANQTREIRIDGELLTIDGVPVAFRDIELQREIGVADAKSAVVDLIGSDGDISNVVQVLLEEAGFGDPEGMEADPI